MDYFWGLLQATLALFAVCGLAWVLLRWGASRGWGVSTGKLIEVRELTRLSPKHSVCVVRVGDVDYLLGLGDGQAPRLISEVQVPDGRSGGPPSGPDAGAET